MDARGPTAIEMTDVAFAYRSGSGLGVPILSDMNLAIREGEFFSLLGPSGCGKTTALRLIAGFEEPTDGKLAAYGKPIRQPGEDRGVVFQGDDALFPWLTTERNVDFGLRMKGVPLTSRKEIAARFVSLVGLVGHESKYPRQLSGGMKQRIQIARVLANDPRILLMDEPFGSLDAQTREELQDELVRIWMATKKTILFITHDIAEALLLSDRIGVMRRGPQAAIDQIVEIDLPRPRSRAHPRFGAWYEELGSIIRTHGGTKHGAD